MEQLSESSLRDSADATSSLSPTVADGGGDGGEALARVLSAMLESVIRDFDSKALGTLNSQDQLSGSLDRLVQGTNSSSSGFKFSFNRCCIDRIAIAFLTFLRFL